MSKQKLTDEQYDLIADLHELWATSTGHDRGLDTMKWGISEDAFVAGFLAGIYATKYHYGTET